MPTNNVKRNTTLMEYLARRLHSLPEDHEINQAFGVKLSYPEGSGVGSKERNIYLFNFPSNIESEKDAHYAAQFDIPHNIALSPKPGVCITPTAGRTPHYAMGAWSPSFTILCRHEYAGRAYECAQEMLYYFNLHSRVFPQNGCIYAATSQPRHVFSSSGGACSTYAADFTSKVAERIL